MVIPKEKLAAALKIAENPRAFVAAQKIVTNIVNGRGETMKSILESSGYKPSIARDSPDKVTKKPSFQAVLDALMPDDFLVARHTELISQDKELKVARDSLELAYRVKGHLKDNAMPAGAALLGMMLGQQQLEQPTIYADVEVQSVNNEPTDDKTPEAQSDVSST